MSQFAQLNAARTQVVTAVELDPALVAGWGATGNPKATGYLPIVVDAVPVASTTQIVANAGYVIEATQVRQTWALIDKTADQLEADALRVEKDQINAYLADLQTQLDISNATRAALTNAQRINELEKDTRASMKAVKFLLRVIKRSL